MPRVYPTLPHRSILRLFDSGRYRVDVDEGVIYSGRTGKPLGTFSGSAEGDYYQFVRLYHRGKRRAYAVHRLVWMVTTRRIIPKGFEIHHDNEDVTDNRFCNLFCLHQRDHDKVHQRRRGVVVSEAMAEEIPF